MRAVGLKERLFAGYYTSGAGAESDMKATEGMCAEANGRQGGVVVVVVMR